MTSTTFASLPQELFENIVKRLSAVDIFAVSIPCKELFVKTRKSYLGQTGIMEEPSSSLPIPSSEKLKGNVGQVSNRSKDRYKLCCHRQCFDNNIRI